MKLHFNVTGDKRKELVKLIEQFTGKQREYKGAPSYAFEVDCFWIDRNGIVSYVCEPGEVTIERLIALLYDYGFMAEVDNTEEEPEPYPVLVSDTELTKSGLENLKKILEIKGDLIKKALGTDSLEIIEDGCEYYFPWIVDARDPELDKAVTDFVLALCKMASSLKRINQKESKVENEKYAFRCFLLRLGFIGDEYKEQRKVLLRRLDGSSAFKNGRPE